MIRSRRSVESRRSADELGDRCSGSRSTRSDEGKLLKGEECGPTGIQFFDSERCWVPAWGQSYDLLQKWSREHERYM